MLFYLLSRVITIWLKLIIPHCVFTTCGITLGDYSIVTRRGFAAIWTCMTLLRCCIGCSIITGFATVHQNFLTTAKITTTIRFRHIIGTRPKPILIRLTIIRVTIFYYQIFGAYFVCIFIRTTRTDSSRGTSSHPVSHFSHVDTISPPNSCTFKLVQPFISG